MTTSIVTVAVNLTVAPTPPTLQSTGALISQGATTLAAGNYSELTQLSDLTPLLNGMLAISTLTQVAGLATATASAAHGIPVGDTVELTVAGATPAAYNGTFACTATTTTAFTYAVPSGTGTPATGTIKYTPEDVGELLSMATTYFAQGLSQSVCVLELGLIDDADAIVALNTYITANPASAYVVGELGVFYGFLVPRAWAGDGTYPAFVANYNSPTSKTYFWTTVTLNNYTNFTNLDKSVFAQVEAPGIPGTEFTLAADFYAALSQRPSPTNKVPPFSFTYTFGTTPYPTQGNSAQLNTLLQANVNYIGTGAEGGISNTIIRNGTTMDGRVFTYWYSVDAMQIYSDLNTANEVINGSNNKQNPLYYNQDGIDRLQVREVQTMNSLVTWGLANGQVVATKYNGADLVTALNSGSLNGKIVVNCVPIDDYLEANPGDYKIGEYDGMTGIYIAQNGFIHILFTVNVTDLVATQ